MPEIVGQKSHNNKQKATMKKNIKRVNRRKED